MALASALVAGAAFGQPASQTAPATPAPPPADSTPPPASTSSAAPAPDAPGDAPGEAIPVASAEPAAADAAAAEPTPPASDEVERSGSFGNFGTESGGVDPCKHMGVRKNDQPQSSSNQNCPK
ncbi:MAG: hypothetical protein ACHP7N_13430 [Caulobacterales bacterium]